MVGSKRDITARKEAERRLLESEARFRNLFENIGDALVLLDEDLRVVDCKDTADRIIGFEASEMLGRRFEQAIERLTVMYDGPAIPLTKIICAQKPTMYRAVRLAKKRYGQNFGCVFGRPCLPCATRRQASCGVALPRCH
jgi:PAS domain-containing protein